MANLLKPPSRKQLSRLVGNDQEMVRLLELLFRVASDLTPSEIGLINTALDDLNVRMAFAESDVDSLETRMDEAESDVDSLETRMDEAESDINSNEIAIISLNTDVAENTLDIVSLDNRVGNIESWEIGDLSDVNASLESDGNILIYDSGTGSWEARYITPGTGISIINTAGSITISTTGATGSWTAGSGENITVVNGLVTSIV